MSAPPIGMIVSTPSRNAIAVITMNGVHCASGAAVKNMMPDAIITTASVRLTKCCPLNTTGALEKRRLYLPRPASLPNAMTDPENVIAPMKVPTNSSRRLPRGIGNSTPKAAGSLMTAHGDQHGGQADQRVHRRDQLGHLRHLHALRDDRADDAADRDAAEDQKRHVLAGDRRAPASRPRQSPCRSCRRGCRGARSTDATGPSARK